MTLPLLATPRSPHHHETRTRHGCLTALTTLLAATCLVVSPSFVVRASAGPDPDLASIDAYIEKEMREVHIPGLALGIVHNDEVWSSPRTVEASAIRSSDAREAQQVRPGVP